MPGLEALKNLIAKRKAAGSPPPTAEEESPENLPPEEEVVESPPVPEAGGGDPQSIVDNIASQLESLKAQMPEIAERVDVVMPLIQTILANPRVAGRQPMSGKLPPPRPPMVLAGNGPMVAS